MPEVTLLYRIPSLRIDLELAQKYVIHVKTRGRDLAGPKLTTNNEDMNIKTKFSQKWENT
jgi:hypothetical protein